ncbi:MAG: PQQ-binding-like beta-propeller repeat protein [Gammaproteobacteria bacterium]|nr:PQQ-binding-like beta-propeller repeat protein [Gammaproteobacteria bacterium]
MWDRGNLYVGASGRVICLRKRDGKELWRAKLPKHSDITTILVEQQIVFAATSGIVFALNSRTGDIQWQNNLKASGRVCILGNEAQAGVAAAIQAAQAAAASGAAAAAAAAAGAVVVATST